MIKYSLILTTMLTSCMNDPEFTLTTSQEDPCGANSIAHLIGQPVTALEDWELPENTRILGSESIVTRDYRLDRLNVMVSGKDGEISKDNIITEVQCY